MGSETTCSACGATLVAGNRFCAHCGTANGPTQVPIPVIASAPGSFGVEPGHGARAVTSGRHLDGKVAPIVYGQRATLEASADASKPEPAPWKSDSAGVAHPDVEAASEDSPGRRRAAIILAVVAAMASVWGLASWRLSAQLGSATAAADRFASLHRKPDVANGLGSALADELVVGRFVRADRRLAAAHQAAEVIESPSFTATWKRIVANTQQIAANGAATDRAYSVGLDLTPVVDRLRYSGIARSNARVDPLALGPTGTSPTARGFLGAVFTAALVFASLAIVTGTAALASAKGRWGSVAFAFGVSLAGWSTVTGTAVLVLPGPLIGAAPTRAVRPLVDAARSAITAQLLMVCGATAVLGLVVAVVGWTSGRRTAKSTAK